MIIGETSSSKSSGTKREPVFGSGLSDLEQGPSRLKGSLVEKAREQRSLAQIIQVEDLAEVATTQGVKLSLLMSGDDERNPGINAPIGQAERHLASIGIGKAKLRGEEGRALKAFSSTTVFVPSGEDAPQLGREQQLRRCKFYLSFGAETDDSTVLEMQKDFLIELISLAVAQGVDVGWKVFDHGYDQPDIYTSRPEELMAILRDMYARSDKGIWRDVRRTFQGQISDNIPVEHIGWVQEPVMEPGTGLKNIDSHSGRMRKIGNEYTEAISRGVSSAAAYLQACSLAGVTPDKPWMLSPGYEQEYLERTK